MQNSTASFQRVLLNRTADAMPVQRHDVRRSQAEGGGFEERYWRPFNSPVFAADGSVAWIIHRVEDVTEEVRLKTEGLELRELAAALRESERTSRAVVDALTAHIAIIDEHGCILAVNARWREFARQNGAPVTAVCEGANYLAVCDAASRGGSPEAAGIRDVLAGRSREFSTEYPCHSPTEERWFVARVTPFPGDGPRRAVIAHENITARRLLQNALSQSEAHYRQLIHALPSAVFTCDAQGRITLYNAAAVKLWGRLPSLRDRWNCAHRLFTADGKPLAPARGPMASAVSRGEPIRDAEMIVERPDGSRSHVLAFPDPIHDGSGAVTGAVNILVDITALKLAEKALRTSERNLRTFSRAIEQSPASILITTPSGEIDYVNPMFTEVTGYSFADVVGQTPRVLKSGEQPPAHYREMWKTITAGQVWRGELCNRKKNGELFWEFAVIAPILDDDGAVTHFVAIKEDITERQRAAAALQDREERLRAILNTVVDAIITIDRRGTITGVNPATTRMFGYAEAEMVGQNVSLLMPAPYREEHDGYLANYHRTGQARIIGIGREVQARRKDGTVFPIDLAVSEVGHLHLFTGVIRDITERKRLETEALRMAEQERMRVAADLHDGICQQMVGLQFLSLLLLRDLEKSRHPLAAQARRIEQAIIQTTDDTRQVARGLNPVVADGGGLMLALRQLAETTARSRQMRCIFQCPVPVSIDDPTMANELYRIAQEAIHNAVRHGRAKRITVRLSEAGGQVCLAVADNGCGLPADISRGPGMGLRVMKYRAGLIGGQVIIQPRRRGGTEVICRVARRSTSL